MSKLAQTRLAGLAGLAAAVLGSVLVPATSVQAFPDAKVETETRPNFGLLVRPPIHNRRYRPYGGRGYAHWHREGWHEGDRDDRGGRFGPHWSRETVMIDCNLAHPGDVEEALDAVAPGGTLFMRGGGSACQGNLIIDKPMTLQGDARPGTDFGSADLPATFKGAPGAPCITINVPADGDWKIPRRGSAKEDNPAGRRAEFASDNAVLISDIVIAGEHGGSDACVYSENSTVWLQRTVIRYSGAASAYYLAGGKLKTTELVYMKAGVQVTDTPGDHLPEAILSAESGQLDLYDTTLIGGPVALEAKGTLDGTIQDSIFYLPREQQEASGFGAGTAGVSMHGRSAGVLTIKGTTICGYGIGAFIEGANFAMMDGNHICRAGKGVYLAGGAVAATGNYVEATNVGFQVGAGQPDKREGISDNYIYGANEFIFVEPGGSSAGIQGNHFFGSGSVVADINGDHVTDVIRCRWSDVDDRYFGGRKRPPKKEWQRWRYMSRGHGVFGNCEDPGRYAWPGSDWQETWYGADWVRSIRLDPWDPDVFDANDHYDWDNPFWKANQGGYGGGGYGGGNSGYGGGSGYSGGNSGYGGGSGDHKRDGKRGKRP